MNARREMLLPTAARRGAAFALDLLFPPLCVSCRARVAEPHSLCANCWSDVSFIEGALCASCGVPFEVDPGPDTICGPCHARPHDFARARALFRYDDAVLWRKRHWMCRRGSGIYREIPGFRGMARYECADCTRPNAQPDSW